MQSNHICFGNYNRKLSIGKLTLKQPFSPKILIEADANNENEFDHMKLDNSNIIFGMLCFNFD